MLPKRTKNIRLFKTAIIILFILIIIIFSISRIINYAKGPIIIVNEPQNGLNTSSTTLTIQGQSLHINKITINGRSITTDESGFWQCTIIIFPGLNIITIKAEDQFGRKIERRLDIVGKM